MVMSMNSFMIAEKMYPV